MPKVNHAEDLVGKRVRHLQKTEEGTEEWYEGIVCKMDVKKHGRRTTYMFQVEYVGFAEREWYPLLQDLRKKDLEVLGVRVEDLVVGQKVEQRFVIADSGDEEWWPGQVLKVDQVCDPGNPSFLVEFEEEGEAEGEELGSSNREWFKLFEDYRKGDLRIVSS